MTVPDLDDRHGSFQTYSQVFPERFYLRPISNQERTVQPDEKHGEENRNRI